MAGKTLPGIGEDESGEHEAVDSSDVLRAREASSPALRPGDKPDTKLSSADKTPPSRATDRMPLALPSSSPSRTIIGGPGIVDDDKVAEGLKRLRSLDEPLGPIPNTTPTLKEGIPVVPGLPVPVVTPGLAASEQVRARGTAHGHALSTPGGGQGLVPMTVDDRLKGTLLGHSLHLPDLPSASEESRTPEVRAVAQIAVRPTPSGTHPAGGQQDFSHGDARFFESEPLNLELEPEHPRSTKVVRGIAIFAAIVAVCIVVGFALFRSHKTETVQVPPAEAPPPAAEGTPSPAPADNTGVPAAGTPTAAPGEATPPAAVAVPTPTPPSPAAGQAAADEAARAAAEAEEAQKTETPAAKLKREVAAASTRRASLNNTPPPPPRSRPARSAEPSHSPAAVKPAAAPGKRKAEEDPDGTLPLTE